MSYFTPCIEILKEKMITIAEEEHHGNLITCYKKCLKLKYFFYDASDITLQFIET